jgi:enamine deaminase RidA (YjgF/YER057c/UK114 family)
VSAFDVINPKSLARPRGFSHGVLASPGVRMLFVAGQTAADPLGRVSDPAFAAQFETALERTLVVVESAGGRPEHIVRMTVYVTDMDAYRESRGTLGEIWRRRMGAHYPAMSLVEVNRLVDDEASVEIEATAIVP